MRHRYLATDLSQRKMTEITSMQLLVLYRQHIGVVYEDKKTMQKRGNIESSIVGVEFWNY